MKTSNLILAVLIVIALLAGVLLLIKNSNNPVAEIPTPVTEVPSNASAVIGTVTKVDREQMMVDGPGLVTIKSSDGKEHLIAVPSMGRNLCEANANVTDAYLIEVNDRVSVLGDLDEEGRIIPCSSIAHYLTVETMHTEDEYGFSFVYTKGAQGYILENQPEALAESDAVRLAIKLTETAEYAALQNAGTPREGAPVISVRVFENPQNMSAPVWVERNPNLSGKERIMSELKETVVGGATALQYITDGLYAQDTFVVASGDYIYMLGGMFMDMDSPMHADFLKIIESFKFVPGIQGI